MFDVFWDLGRLFGSFLDTVIYGLIPVIYKLFIYLSEINLFSMNDDSPLSALVGRIYVFLGIFMLFKVTFSLIQYLIDPSSFTDKSKGFGKLVTNAMVTILLLVSVPYIFNYAMVLQNTIVTSNAIGTLIMGNNSGRVVVNTTTQKDRYGNDVVTSSGLSAEKVEEMAKDVQFLMYGAFFSINPEAKIGDNSGEKNACADSPILGTVEMAKNKNGCLDVLKGAFEDKSTPMQSSGTKLTDFFKTSETGTKGDVQDNRNFASFSNLLTWRDSEGKYVIDYLPFISAAAGLYVVFLLITFSVDIAVRAIKLCFLEMVAPIAIVSYIDPKESMSNSKLRNWIKECLTTYLSLFLRIAVLFLVMVLISAIASSVLGENGYISQQVNDKEGVYPIMIYLFLIIGAFMFAKKVPQMIESIFGIKMSGELNLNPFKSAAVAGGLGGLVGSAIGGFAAYNEGKTHGERGLRSAASVLGGATSGLARGALAGGKGAAKGDWLRQSVRTGGDISFAKASRREGGPFGALGATIAGAAGMPYEIDQYDKEIAIRQNVIDQASSIKTKAEDFVANRSNSYKNAAEAIAIARQNGTTFQMEIDGQMQTLNGRNADDITKANSALLKIKKAQAAEFANTGMLEGQNLQNTTDYAEIKATLAGMKQYTDEHKDIDGIDAITDYKSLMDVKDSASIENTKLKQSKAYDDAKQRKEIRQTYARNDWVNEHRK